MKSIVWKRFWILAVLSLALVFAGCGGGSSNEVPVKPVPPVAPVQVAISVSPSSATLAQGGTWQFNATVTGSTNQAVTWSVQEASGGTITNPDPYTAMYTAPDAGGIFHIIATSQADPTKTAIATVTVSPPSAGRFAATGRMLTARVYHTATLLLDDRVLVTGGLTEEAIGNAWDAGTLSSAELYDPATGSFSLVGSMYHPRLSHTATLLNDGRVLIVGGVQGDASVLAAEIFDPASGTFSLTGDLLIARLNPVATQLQDGTVLIAGGFQAGNNLQSSLDTAEIYDPATGTFASAGQMQVHRAFHSVILLFGGQVLAAGGLPYIDVDGNGQPVFNSAELYDPSVGMFFVTGNMTTPRAEFAAAVLLDGKVLVAGGFNNLTFEGSTREAEVYDPAIGSFFPVGAMNARRQTFTAVTLQDGSVLVSGGSGFTSSAELFRPETGTFEVAASMTEFRGGHTATLLTDGRVLLIGGYNSDSRFLASAELYTP